MDRRVQLQCLGGACSATIYVEFYLVGESCLFTCVLQSCSSVNASVQHLHCLRLHAVHTGFPLNCLQALQVLNGRTCSFMLCRASSMIALHSWCTPSPRMQSPPQGACSGAPPSASPARSILTRPTPRTPRTPSPLPSCGPRSTALPCLPGRPALRRWGASCSQPWRNA